MAVIPLRGGERLMNALAGMDARLKAASGEATVSVGFLEGSTYPDGTSTPMVAAIQEFGGTIDHPPGNQTIYRKVNAGGVFLRNGRFVKRKESNFSSTHARKAYTQVIPPRPYFRNMIADKSPTWPAAVSRILKATDYDTAKTLGLMGDLIKGQLQASIVALTSPPNAPSTIARKGSSKPLIDTGHMLNSVDYEVKQGTTP